MAGGPAAGPRQSSRTPAAIQRRSSNASGSPAVTRFQPGTVCTSTPTSCPRLAPDVSSSPAAVWSSSRSPNAGAHRPIRVGGRLVRTLRRGDLAPGRHEATWDGRDDRGVAAASGVYVSRPEVGAGTLNREMTLVR